MPVGASKPSKPGRYSDVLLGNSVIEKHFEDKEKHARKAACAKRLDHSEAKRDNTSTATTADAAPKPQSSRDNRLRNTVVGNKAQRTVGRTRGSQDQQSEQENEREKNLPARDGGGGGGEAEEEGEERGAAAEYVPHDYLWKTTEQLDTQGHAVDKVAYGEESSQLLLDQLNLFLTTGGFWDPR